MKFENTLIVSVKKAKHKRLFVLQESLICTDNQGRVWEVPKGFPTDFASIPAFARAFIDKAHQNAYAAVLHDYLYYTQPVSRAEADALFYEALASPDCNTDEFTRWIMYRAVRLGGESAWNFWHQTPETEINNMADETMIEDDEKNAFVEWFKRWWNRADQELDELEDEVRVRALRLFRQANWPGVRDREALYRKKARKSFAFKIAYALVFLSSCITLYYWWGAMPDLTSKLLIGLGFFGANLLMPLWARMTFWQGGTWLQALVNFVGLMILLSVSAASIVASAGLQGTKSDETRAVREQQVLQYKTQIERVKQRNKRLAELRAATMRAPSEIKAELDGLLVTEPAPQSACLSRDNFGSWSKRNCPTVARLRVEIRQAEERVRLEQQAKVQTFENTAPVTSVDPQYEIIQRYLDVDRETFNNAKPLILAILLEMIFNGLTLLLTITIGAEVREEIKEKIEKQKRALIGQAESEVDANRRPPEPTNPAPVIAPEPEPLAPAPAVAAVQPNPVVVVAAQQPQPEAQPQTGLESAVIANPVTYNNLPVVSYEPEPEPEATKLSDLLPAVLQKAQEPIIDNASPAIEPTEAKTIEVEPELLEAKQEPADETVAESERNNELQSEVLKLRLQNLVNERSTSAGVRLAAQYALSRVKREPGSMVKLEFVWKDYAAWCSITGNVAADSIADLRELLTGGLSLKVETIDGAEFVIDTVLKS